MLSFVNTSEPCLGPKAAQSKLKALFTLPSTLASVPAADGNHSMLCQPFNIALCGSRFRQLPESQPPRTARDADQWAQP